MLFNQPPVYIIYYTLEMDSQNPESLIVQTKKTYAGIREVNIITNTGQL